ncbi:hypothetical protein ACF9IK_09200 [Kitasatospora hibisci]|uniref:hypothetical protein n=1 Tax=Kitasatospora hibisci TaxID=3369522 RepID=UPI003754A6AC
MAPRPPAAARPPGHLADVTDDLRRPSEEALRAGAAPGDVVEAAVLARTPQTVAAPHHDRLLRPLIAAGRLRVAGAHYGLGSGRVGSSG